MSERASAQTKAIQGGTVLWNWSCVLPIICQWWQIASIIYSHYSRGSIFNQAENCRGSELKWPVRRSLNSPPIKLLPLTIRYNHACQWARANGRAWVLCKKKVKGHKNDDLMQSFRSNDKVICYCKQSVLCVRKLLEKAISTAVLSLSERGNLQWKPLHS